MSDGQAAGSTATADELSAVLVAGLDALIDWVDATESRALGDEAAADEPAHRVDRRDASTEEAT